MTPSAAEGASPVDPGEVLAQPDIFLEIEALRRRVEELEQRGSGVAPAPPAAVPLNRAPSGELASARQSDAVMGALLGVPLPSYTAMTLTQTHQALTRRDVARQSGNAGLADAIDEEIAGLICVTMNRVVDEYEDPGLDLSDADPGIFHKPTERQQELQILRLVGLSPWLADEHIRVALQTVGDGIRGSSPEKVVSALSAVERAACSSHRQLVAARVAREIDERNRARNRRRIKRLVFGLGGVTIVLANGLASGLGAPFLAPASIALGSAAAGSIANVVED